MAGLEGCSCAAASIRRTACCVCPRAAMARPSSCSASVLPGSRASTSRYSGTASVSPPREDGIEVLHVADVVPVIAPEFLEVVAEIDAAAEELLVAGEAAAKWMSPRVNDRGTRKHQLDEAYMTEVAQHLIDEARLARGAIYLGPRQVARGETFDLQAPERGDGLGILRRFAAMGARPQLQ